MWHQAASDANFDNYFNLLDDSAVFLGTQYDERWEKQDFIKFSKPYFDKGKAWDFKPFNRKLYNTENGNFIWFEESLYTWMGVCRGTGVVVSRGDEFKIIHYSLSVTISNDLVKDFVDVVKKDPVNNFLNE